MSLKQDKVRLSHHLQNLKTKQKHISLTKIRYAPPPSFMSLFAIVRSLIFTSHTHTHPSFSPNNNSPFLVIDVVHLGPPQGQGRWTTWTKLRNLPSSCFSVFQLISGNSGELKRPAKPIFVDSSEGRGERANRKRKGKQKARFLLLSTLPFEFQSSSGGFKQPKPGNFFESSGLRTPLNAHITMTISVLYMDTFKYIYIYITKYFPVHEFYDFFPPVILEVCIFFY